MNALPPTICLPKPSAAQVLIKEMMIFEPSTHPAASDVLGRLKSINEKYTLIWLCIAIFYKHIAYLFVY